MADSTRTEWPLTYQRLIEIAESLDGQTLHTVTGKAYTVGLYRHVPFFTPASSGYGQGDGRKATQRFVERYNETRSLRPGDYTDVTRNASYLIGMLIAVSPSE
jgi:hypothetical protein